MKYLLLDVAGTILYKPQLFTRILKVLNNNGFDVSLNRIKFNHKLLSEAIKFPDRTDYDFYLNFNSELVYSLGIIPTNDLLKSIFEACSYLPWEKFEDVEILNEIKVPIGIVSNFNSSLKEKLKENFGEIFSDIFVSEELGVAKPSIEFYRRALEQIKIEPEDILYIGDSFKLDFAPAKSLGMNTYVIDRENFYGHNVNTISSLSQINNIL